MDGAATAKNGGFLGWIERSGNKLPDPVFLFFYFILALIAISLVADLMGLGAAHPTEIDPDTGAARIIAAESLLSSENIRRLWNEMPETYTHFHPLGYVLIVMFGAGVAERVGLFGTAMRAGLRNAPRALLTPLVVFVGMMGNHAADAGYVVLIPLSGIIFHAAGRHPIAGIAAGFAGVSGGFSANLIPGQLDALLFGITEASVETVFGDYAANIAGNWYFIAGMTFIFLPVIWYVNDRIVEPRLGTWDPQFADAKLAGPQEDRPLTEGESKGLRWAGLAVLAVCAVWALFVFMPNAPLYDAQAAPEARLAPFYKSLVAFFMVLFLAAGWAYGKATGVIGNHRDLVKMMTGAMEDMAYYLVLVLAISHFVAMFGWSNLGLILAVFGADVLGSSGLPAWALLAAIILVSAFINLFVGSASAKWALLGPVLVPMLMLLGISPEMATAAYRVGDSATNIITPLMTFFPLILIFAQRWDRNFGLGSLTAMMLPFSIGLMIAGLAMTIGWVVFDLPLGPGADVFIETPTTIEPAGAVSTG
ncbi:AbgT family transporter [Altererythrobacter arenosus]|uniref:AbgT family transporter n=1 Tax=Altererythrobacter arenosus TaxID=3032592 RepID=A0ABY8FUP5_9SPHN|nr:AbgT family transporter [Altererythrobacter sp. CAU 1644]WFL77825.1 AbgT family transporter [Altererythrobacter sp. CAU 1644]